MALLLFLLTAAVLLWLAHRLVSPLGCAVGAMLIPLPFLFFGKPLLPGGVYAPVYLPYLTEPLKAMREPLGVAPPQNGVLSDLYAQMIPGRKGGEFAVI